jgi:sensor histidine kinase YesM
VEKKKKRACSLLVLAPFVCEWAGVGLSKISSKVITMWLNVGMVSSIEAASINGILALVFYIVASIAMFFISKKALKKIEKSWK